jgi:hypothetical protein
MQWERREEENNKKEKREKNIQTFKEDKHTDGEQLQTYLNCSNYKVSIYSEKRVKKIERKHTNRCKKQTHRWRIVTNVHTLK